SSIWTCASSLPQRPKANRSLSRIKELAGKGDHAVDEVGFDDSAADFAFAALIRGHAAIGEDEAGHAAGREVIDEVLHPGEVGVAARRQAELPARVVVFTEPVGVVEGWIGEDEVGAEIGMDIAPECVGLLFAKIGFDAADGEVHHSEAAGGGVALLTVDADVAEPAAMGFDKFFRLHEHAAGTAAGVVNAAFVGSEHLDKEAHDT